jgi:hypothetical protein
MPACLDVLPSWKLGNKPHAIYVGCVQGPKQLKGSAVIINLTLLNPPKKPPAQPPPGIHHHHQEVNQPDRTYTYPQPATKILASTPGSLFTRHGGSLLLQRGQTPVLNASSDNFWNAWTSVICKAPLPASASASELRK